MLEFFFFIKAFFIIKHRRWFVLSMKKKCFVSNIINISSLSQNMKEKIIYGNYKRRTRHNEPASFFLLQHIFLREWKKVKMFELHDVLSPPPHI